MKPLEINSGTLIFFKQTKTNNFLSTIHLQKKAPQWKRRMKYRKPVFLSRSVGLLPSTLPLYRDEQLIWDHRPKPSKKCCVPFVFRFRTMFLYTHWSLVSYRDHVTAGHGFARSCGSSYQVVPKNWSMALPAAVADGVKECLKKAHGGSLAGALGDLLQLLLKEGYAYTQRTNSVHIGCHPSNRDGTGISTSHVQSLASQFFELGFDPSLQRPICVELSTSDEAVRKWNEEMTGLAPVANLRFASLSASHTNQVLTGFHLWHAS